MYFQLLAATVFLWQPSGRRSVNGCLPLDLEGYQGFTSYTFFFDLSSLTSIYWLVHQAVGCVHTTHTYICFHLSAVQLDIRGQIERQQVFSPGQYDLVMEQYDEAYRWRPSRHLDLYIPPPPPAAPSKEVITPPPPLSKTSTAVDSNEASLGGASLIYGEWVDGWEQECVGTMCCRFCHCICIMKAAGCGWLQIFGAFEWGSVHGAWWGSHQLPPSSAFYHILLVACTAAHLQLPLLLLASYIYE